MCPGSSLEMHRSASIIDEDRLKRLKSKRFNGQIEQRCAGLKWVFEVSYKRRIGLKYGALPN